MPITFRDVAGIGRLSLPLGLNNVSDNQATGNKAVGMPELQRGALYFKMGKSKTKKPTQGRSCSGQLGLIKSGDLGSAGVPGQPPQLLAGQ